MTLSSSLRHLSAVTSLLWACAAARAQDGNFPVAQTKGLTPDEAAKTMTLPPGFRATPFAGEPAIHQPIAFKSTNAGGSGWSRTSPTRTGRPTARIAS